MSPQAACPDVEVARAFQELKGIETQKGVPQPETILEPRASVQAIAAHAGVPKPEELYGFLSPARTPDELGRLGPYRVLRLLGIGGMGVVFEAEDPQLKRLVALKVMKPVLAASESSRLRFLREAQAAAAIEHDHIITIYQVGEDRGMPFLAMPLLRGETLEQRLHRERKLTIGEVLRIGREIAEGLNAAHQRGLMHRDIKPGNIWLEEGRGRVKILDFGLARGAGEGHLTAAGGIMGTPAYMAPEQAAGEEVDFRCDLFSLGAVLYRASTGRLPFLGMSAAAVMTALMTENPKPVRELEPALPPGLERLIMQLLVKSHAQRLGSAGKVIEAIEALERELQTRSSAMLPTVSPIPSAAADGIPGAVLSCTRALEWVSTPLTPGVRIGPYEITALLGSDRSGRSYAAHDLERDRPVVLKLLYPEVLPDAGALAAFRRQLAALAGLNHPNIATIYGLEDHSGQLCLVSEWVPGRTLAEWIATGPLPLLEALMICGQLVDALEAAHKHGIVHGDLQPENIRVTRQGKLKLFHFAFAPPGDGSRGTGSHPSLQFGNLAYQSPEQLQGRPVDERSDIWSFGCILYELLTSHRSFPAEEPADIYAAVVAGTPDWNPLSRVAAQRIRRLLRRCLMKDPDWRPQHMGRIRDELQAAVKESGEGTATGESTSLPEEPQVAVREFGNGTLVRESSISPELPWINLPAPDAGAWKRSVLAGLVLLVLSGLAGWWFLDSFQAVRGVGPKGPVRKLMAVADFDAPAGDQEIRKLADSLVRAVGARLDQTAELQRRVITHEQVVSFKNPGTGNYPWATWVEAGRTMRVARVLRGDLIRQGSTFTVRIRLLDPEAEQVLFQEQFQRDLSTANDATSQEALAAEIADKVRGWLVDDQSLDARPANMP